VANDSARRKSFFHKARLYVLVTISVLAIIIIFQNMKPVETQILFFTRRMPHAALLAGTTLAGFVSGVLWSSFRRR